MLYTKRLKETIVFVMFLIFGIDTNFSVLAQARAEEAAKSQGFISSMYDKAAATVEAGVSKCKAVASDVVNYSKDLLGPLADTTLGNCAKEAFKGAFSTTAGAVIDTVQTAGKAIGTAAGAADVCLSDAAICGKKIMGGAASAVNSVADGATKAAQAVTECAGDPSGCARQITTKIKNVASFVTDLLGQLRESFSNASFKELVGLACHILSALAAPVLLSIATGGVAAGLLGVRMAKFVQFLQQLASVGPIGTMMKIMNLPFEVVMKLSGSAIERMVALLKKDASLAPKIKEAVMSCSIR